MQHFPMVYLTNRCHVAAGLFSSRSRKTSKCCENISDITSNDHVVALDQLAREKSLSVEDPPDLSDSMSLTQSSPLL